MLKKSEIIEIMDLILKKSNLATKIKFLDQSNFTKLALKSTIIAQTIKEGSTLRSLGIPALFSHIKNTIYLSEQVIKEVLKDEPISLQKRFIQAITYHEIYHIKSSVQETDFNSSLIREEQARKQFKKDFPGLEAVGRKLIRKYIEDNKKL